MANRCSSAFWDELLQPSLIITNLGPDFCHKSKFGASKTKRKAATSTIKANNWRIPPKS